MDDTIVALATPAGNAGISVIRISGMRVKEVMLTIVRQSLKPRHATLADFYDKHTIIDQGIAIFFPGPNSFTGEDILELHTHGGFTVANMALRLSLQLGARIADPGEFSKRAFLNNKIDLLQAEAIADLINSNSELAARAAAKSLQGEFSKKINHQVDKLTSLRIMLEAAIDFPDEDLDLLAEQTILASYYELHADLKELLENSIVGNKLNQGVKVVIAGNPNVGKSTLLNLLVNKPAAIVTEIAGTTRDVMREAIDICGSLFNLSDTAGIRQTDDLIEKEGIKRSYQEIEQADHLLWVTDDKITAAEVDRIQKNILPENCALTVIINKADINGAVVGMYAKDYQCIVVSAKQKAGIDLIKQHLKDSAIGDAALENVYIARQRHVDALEQSVKILSQGIEQLARGPALELMAEDLKYAQESLSAITGKLTADDLLGKIFSSFCIGK